MGGWGEGGIPLGGGGGVVVAPDPRAYMSAGDRQRVVENLSRTIPVLVKDTMQRK